MAPEFFLDYYSHVSFRKIDLFLKKRKNALENAIFRQKKKNRLPFSFPLFCTCATIIVKKKENCWPSSLWIATLQWLILFASPLKRRFFYRLFSPFFVWAMIWSQSRPLSTHKQSSAYTPFILNSNGTLLLRAMCISYASPTF